MAGPVLKRTGGSGSGSFPNPMWFRDAVPDGLHSSSWNRGDALDSWQYFTDEVGTVSQDDYGMTIGTVAELFNPFIALPTGDCSLTVAMDMGYSSTTVSGFHGAGIFAGNLLGESTTTADFYRLFQSWNGYTPTITTQQWNNGAFAATLSSLTGGHPVMAPVYRLGINAARTELHFSASLDYGHSFFHVHRLTSPTHTCDAWGVRVTPANNIVHIPWFRVRTGTDEHLNVSPEGAILE